MMARYMIQPDLMHAWVEALYTDSTGTSHKKVTRKSYILNVFTIPV